MVLKPTSGIGVDGACSGNPGPAEYKGIDLKTDKELFHISIGNSTNNIAEFIGVIHAYAYSEKHNMNAIIWTDSMTAISWIKNKKVKTTFTEYNDILERAKKYLFLTTFDMTRIKKWNTKEWGEIPADFGRK